MRRRRSPMKNKIKWFIFLTLLLLIAVVGLLALTFKVPDFAGIDAIEIEGMDGKQLKASIQAKVYNPNFYGLSARKIDYIVTYRDTVIGKGVLPQGLSLSAADTTQLSLPLTMELDAIFAVYKSMLGLRRCKLDIHLDGEFTFLHYRHGLDLETEVETDKFISQILGKSLGSEDLSMEEMRWKSTNLKTSEFSFVSVVKNPLDIPLELRSLDIVLYNEGKSSRAGAWKMEKATPLKPQYSTRLPGSIQVNHLGASAGVINTVFKGELRFDAKGTMVLQLADLPFEIPIEGKVVIDPKTGKGRWE